MYFVFLSQIFYVKGRKSTFLKGILLTAIDETNIRRLKIV
jgi:hypothetical protein